MALCTDLDNTPATPKALAIEGNSSMDRRKDMEPMKLKKENLQATSKTMSSTAKEPSNGETGEGMKVNSLTVSFTVKAKSFLPTAIFWKESGMKVMENNFTQSLIDDRSSLIKLLQIIKHLYIFVICRILIKKKRKV